MFGITRPLQLSVLLYAQMLLKLPKHDEISG